MDKDSEIRKNQMEATSEMISSGVYFKDALNWYQEIFLAPSVTKINYFIFLATNIIGLSLTILFIISMFPLKVKETIIFESDRDNDTYVRAVQLQRYENPAKNILMKSIENYVIRRESYAANNKSALQVISDKQDFVQNNSTAEVLNNYREWVNNYNNVTGDFIVSGIEVKAYVTNFNFVELKKDFFSNIYYQFIPVPPPSSARIELMTINTNGRQRNWTIDISYRFRLYRNSETKENEIDFKVTSYDIKSIN